MLIYEAIKKDHDKIRGLLNELLTLDGDLEHEHRQDVIAQIRDELIPHSRAEEAVFYNSLRALDPAKDMIMHSYAEHVETETLLKTLQMIEFLDADWKRVARKLKELLENHMREEEHRIFNVAKQLFTVDEATQFAQAFERMKPEVRDEGYVSNTLDLVKDLMPPRFIKTLQGRDSTIYT